MFQYRCPTCGVTAYSSASYATVGICPSCESPLADAALETIPEPAAISVTGRPNAAGDGYPSASRKPSRQLG
jgi:hypothetical protein